MSEEEHTIIMARALRLAAVKNVLGQGFLTRDEALELLNRPLSPDDLDAPVYDDRDKLDWSQEQFVEWMKGGE
jgi:hypothetical protein